VLFEIQMLGALAGYIRTGEVDEAVADLAYKGVPARNAVIESFELHARNLIEFLIHQQGRGAATTADYTRKRNICATPVRSIWLPPVHALPSTNRACSTRSIS